MRKFSRLASYVYFECVHFEPSADQCNHSEIFYQGGMSDDDWRRFAHAVIRPACESVESLYLFYAHMGAMGAQYIFESVVLSNIVDVNLEGSMIGDDGAKRISSYLPGSRIVTLKLEKNEISEKGAKYIARGISGSRVNYLVMSHNCIGDIGATYISECLEHSKLEWIELGKCNIRNTGGVAIFEQLSKSKVWRIDLSGNCVDDEGMQRISLLISQTKLRKLDLAGNRFGDAHLPMFSISTLFSDLRPTRFDLNLRARHTTSDMIYKVSMSACSRGKYREFSRVTLQLLCYRSILLHNINMDGAIPEIVIQGLGLALADISTFQPIEVLEHSPPHLEFKYLNMEKPID
jgi:Leucine Rich Repeat (LRR) protein